MSLPCDASEKLFAVCFASLSINTALQPTAGKPVKLRNEHKLGGIWGAVNLFQNSCELVHFDLCELNFEPA